MADENILHIDVSVENISKFTKEINAAVDPLERLNRVANDLVRTLNKLDGTNAGLSGLKKVAKDLGEVVTLINSQKTLGRGNLENLSRTASTVKNFVEMISKLDDVIGTGGFTNIDRFTGIMKQIGSAFAALDKIKKPANLVAVQVGVQAIEEIIKLISKMPVASTALFRRLKIIFVIKPFMNSLATALSAFDKIQRPESLQNAFAAIMGLEKLLELLASKFSTFNIIQRISRAMKLRQLTNVARQLANALMQFDQIKSPKTIEAVPKAINSLSRIIDTLANVSKQGDKLARIRLFGGFITQRGTLLSGFKAFARQISGIIKIFAKFNPSQIKSMTAASEIIKSLTQFIKLFQTNASVMLKGGDVIADFSQKTINADAFKTYIDSIITVAQYISKSKFDAAKVTAFGNLANIMSQFGSLNFDKMTGAGKTPSGLNSLKTMASNVINSVISIFKHGASLIGSIFSTLFRSNPFLNLVTHAQQTISRISQSMRQFGREMSMLGTQMLATGGVAGFIQSQQVGMVMDFESIMKQIKVLGGVTGEELTKAEQLILQLGESSVFTASEVAAAFLDLSKAGLSFDQINVSLEDMLNLAAAGGISVSDAAKLVINAVNAFDNLEFGDAEYIVNKFVAAANVGVATVEQLSNAFGYAANTANVFGQDLDQVTAALTLMMDRAIPDERAGTSLDAFMRAMIKPSGPAAEAITKVSQALIEMETQSGALTKLGVSFEGDLAGLMTDAQGNYRDLSTIIKLVTVATKDWTEEERANTLSIMAGSANAGRALLALLGQYEDGTFVIDAYLQKQAESASAQTVATTLMDTARGAIEEMTGAFQSLLIKALMPVVKYGVHPLVDGITFLIRLISQLPQPVLAATAAFIGLSTILITIVGSALLFGGMLTQLIGFGLTPLVSLLWAIVNPLKAIMIITAGSGIIAGLFIGAAIFVPLIASIVAGIKAFGEGLKDLQGSAVMQAFSDAFTRLKTTISEVGSAFTRFIDIIFKIISASPNNNTGLVAFIITQITNLMNTVSGALGPLADMFNMLSSFTTIKPSGMLELFTGDLVSNPLEFKNWLPLQDQITEAAGLTKEAFAEAFNVPLEDLEGAFNFDIAKDYLVMNSTDYENEIKKLREMSEAAGGVAKAFGLEGAATVDTGFLRQSTVDTLKDTAVQFRTIDQVLRMLDEDSGAFKNLANSLEPFADNPIIEMIFGDDVTGTQLARTLSVFVSTLYNIRDAGSSALRRFAEFFDDLRNGVGVTKSFSNLIKGLIVDAGKLAAIFLDVVTNMLGIEGFEGIINNLAQGNLKGVLVEFGNFIVQTLFDSIKAALELGGKIVQWSWKTLINFVDDVDWISEWGKVTDGITSIVDVTSGIITWSWDKLITFYGDINWGAEWDKIKPDVDTFLAEKIVIPLADIFSFDLPTRQIESDSIIPLTVTDTDSVIGTVSKITSAIEEIINRLKDAVSGPGVALIKGTIEDIANALKSLTNLDTESLKVLGLVLSPVLLGLVAPFAAAVGPWLVALVVIRGFAKALPDLVEALNDFASNDWGEGFGHLKDAIGSFWEGVKDTLLQLIDLIATLFGVENVFTEENYQKGLDGFRTAFEAMAKLIEFAILKVKIAFLDFIISIAEGISGGAIGDVLSFAGFEFDLGADTLQKQRDDLQAALDQFMAQGGAGVVIPVTPELAAGDPAAMAASLSGIISGALMGYGVENKDELTAAFTTMFGTADLGTALMSALQLAQMDPNALVAGTNITTEDALMFAFGVDQTTLTASVQSGLDAVTAGLTPASAGKINTWLTGKPSGTALGGPDVIDVLSIQTASEQAGAAVNTFGTNAATDVGKARTEVQGLSADLAAMTQAFGWNITFTPIAPVLNTDRNSDMPARARAFGGPVFAGRLYEVAEKGMSELLKIGRQTFLIPGENGTVIPAATSPALVPSSNETNTTNYGGNVYTDNATYMFQIDAENMTPAQLKGVIDDIVSERGADRTRSIQRRLRAAGRGGR